MVIQVRLITISLILLIIVSTIGCASPNFNHLDQVYANDYVVIDVPEEYGVSLVHPGRGWEMIYDVHQQKRWKKIGMESEFEFHVIGTVNTDQFRVDKCGDWSVISQSELHFEGLQQPVIFTHAFKDMAGSEIGVLQIYFSRSYNAPQPWYYIITLRNYDFIYDQDYQDIFTEIIDSLHLEFE